MDYWGGTTEKRQCGCALTDSCAHRDKKCNCDYRDNTWHEDSGLLTEKAFLSVFQLRFGDTEKDGSEGYHTLGNLKCYGISTSHHQWLAYPWNSSDLSYQNALFSIHATQTRSSHSYSEVHFDFFFLTVIIDGSNIVYRPFFFFLDQVQANIRKLRFLVLSGLDQNIQILNLLHSNEDSPIYSIKISA